MTAWRDKNPFICGEHIDKSEEAHELVIATRKPGDAKNWEFKTIPYTSRREVESAIIQLKDAYEKKGEHDRIYQFWYFNTYQCAYCEKLDQLRVKGETND